MALEFRGSNIYYYRKKRDGNRVKSEYLGSGEYALLAARWEEMEREERGNKHKIDPENVQKLADIDQNLDEIEQKSKILIESFLVSKGFYKTKSREWRLKGNGNKS